MSYGVVSEYACKKNSSVIVLLKPSPLCNHYLEMILTYIVLLDFELTTSHNPYSYSRRQHNNILNSSHVEEELLGQFVNAIVSDLQFKRDFSVTTTSSPVPKCLIRVYIVRRICSTYIQKKKSLSAYVQVEIVVSAH